MNIDLSIITIHLQMSIIIAPRRFDQDIFRQFVLACLLAKEGRSEDEINGYLTRLRTPGPIPELDEFSRQTELDDWRYQQNMCNVNGFTTFTGHFETDQTLRKWITGTRFFFPHQFNILKSTADSITRSRLDQWHQFLQEMVYSLQQLKALPAPPKCKARVPGVLDHVMPPPVEDPMVVAVLEKAIKHYSLASLDEILATLNKIKKAPPEVRYKLSKIKSKPTDELTTVKNMHAYLRSIARDTLDEEEKATLAAIHAVLHDPELAVDPAVETEVAETRLVETLIEEKKTAYSSAAAAGGGPLPVVPDGLSAPAAAPGSSSAEAYEEEVDTGEREIPGDVVEEAIHFLKQLPSEFKGIKSLKRIAKDNPRLQQHYNNARMCFKELARIAPLLTAELTNHYLRLLPTFNDCVGRLHVFLGLKEPEKLEPAYRDLIDRILIFHRAVVHATLLDKALRYREALDDGAIKPIFELEEYAAYWSLNDAPCIMDDFPTYKMLVEKKVSPDIDAYKSISVYFTEQLERMDWVANHIYKYNFAGNTSGVKTMFIQAARILEDEPTATGDYAPIIDKLVAIIDQALKIRVVDVDYDPTLFDVPPAAAPVGGAGAEHSIFEVDEEDEHKIAVTAGGGGGSVPDLGISPVGTTGGHVLPEAPPLPSSKPPSVAGGPPAAPPVPEGSVHGTEHKVPGLTTATPVVPKPAGKPGAKAKPKPSGMSVADELSSRLKAGGGLKSRPKDGGKPPKPLGELATLMAAMKAKAAATFAATHGSEASSEAGSGFD